MSTPEAYPRGSIDPDDNNIRDCSRDVDRANDGDPPDGDGSGGDSQGIGQLSLDDTLTLLSNSRRRAFLRALEESDGELSFSDIVAEVAEDEYGRPRAQISSRERKRVYTALYQSHVQKLSESGAIDYERPSSTIRRGECFADLIAYLDRLERAGHQQQGAQKTLRAHVSRAFHSLAD